MFINIFVLIFSFSTTMALTSQTIAVPQSQWPGLLQRLRRELVDLHSGEFCVDVSTFAEVEFKPVKRTKCDTIFEKKCMDKSKNVCDQVWEIKCEIVPFADCQMGMDATPYRSFENVHKIFTKKICKEDTKIVPHAKLLPECKNVTKQNCVTKWEVDENGNQIWAGNEDCEPVTWTECKLVRKAVDFKVPNVTCFDGERIPYTDCEETQKTEMTSKTTCEVKHTTHCNAVPKTKCKVLNYQECAEEPLEKCVEIEVKIPIQQKDHKKKCLFPNDNDQTASPFHHAKHDHVFDLQQRGAKALEHVDSPPLTVVYPKMKDDNTA